MSNLGIPAVRMPLMHTTTTTRRMIKRNNDGQKSRRKKNNADHFPPFVVPGHIALSDFPSIPANPSLLLSCGM